jgi:hypothetical protein
LAVIDRFGNSVDKRTIPMDLRGMPACKRLSLLRQAIAAIITLCQELQRPLAHEKLDFGNKKLANNDIKPNELLNMMPTAILAQVIVSACLRGGVEELPVGPAYTSMIGAKYAGYGYSGHHGAAVVITRRAVGFSCQKKGERVAFRDPASRAERFILRRGEHRFSAWRRHTTRLGVLKRKARAAPQAKDGRSKSTRTVTHFILESGQKRSALAPLPGSACHEGEAARNRTCGV